MTTLATDPPDDALARTALALPEIHCPGCIRGIEDLLTAQPGVTGARVNLSRKRVVVTSRGDPDPVGWIAALAGAGHEANETSTAPEDAEADALLLRLGVAGFAMMNVMLLSVGVWSGAEDATRDLLHWVSALVALPAALYCAQPFFVSAWRGLRAGRMTMDLPISVAVLLACGLSLSETMAGGEHAYFDAALSLTFFLLAGRYLERRTRGAARSAAADLAALEPRRVMRMENGVPIRRTVEEVAPGDTLRLAAGDRAPVDARVLAQAEVDRSALTGESAPVTVRAGDHLAAGEVVLTGPVEICATAACGDSTLRRMAELAAHAETARGTYDALADRAARIYAPLVHAVALIGFFAWWGLTGDAHHAATVAIATLIITCPCALGLAAPAVAAAATTRLFRLGALVKSDTALERLAAADTVVFDKTGTLTQPVLEIPDRVPADHLGVLRALAGGSNHPLCRQLARDLSETQAATLSDIRERGGLGVEGVWRGLTARLGDGAWAGDQPGELVLSVGGVAHRLRRAERPAPEAAAAVRDLRAAGLRVSMLTGDTLSRGAEMAAQLGVTDVQANLRPGDKLRHIRDLAAMGRKALMVGDGLNDTLALTEAHVSIAPGAAMEASRNAADIVLLGGDLRMIDAARRIARIARRRVLQNFALAGAYNALAIPLALAGFATPLMAAVAMSSSSILVILNALRLR